LIYFFTWISAVLAPLSFFIFTGSSQAAFENFGIQIFNVHWTFYIVLSLSVLGCFLFLAMIYHLKKAAYQITPYRFVDEEIGRHFFKAGWYCIVGTLITRIPAVIYKYSTLSLVKSIGFNADTTDVRLGMSFDSILVIIAFGIFMIIISKIIKQSVKIKCENDLTI
jgi:hypothetical protein